MNHPYYVEPVIMVRKSCNKYKIAVVLGETPEGHLVYREESDTYVRAGIASAQAVVEKQNLPKHVAICPQCKFATDVRAQKLIRHDSPQGSCPGSGLPVPGRR